MIRARPPRRDDATPAPQTSPDTMRPVQRVAAASRFTPDIGHVPIVATTPRALPPALRTRVERQSGIAMDHVRVHRESAEPQRIGALAFARGDAIHLAPGQDRHLPHEAWHLVQQAQGRVRPTRQVAGIGVNDSAALEREADLFGSGGTPAPMSPAVRDHTAPETAQRVIDIEDGDLKGVYNKAGSQGTKGLIAKVDTAIGSELARGWKGDVALWAKDTQTWAFDDSTDFLDHLKSEYEKADKGDGKSARPNFPASSYRLAAISYGLQTGQDESQTSLSDNNLAMPHRFPYAAIQYSTQLFIDGNENTATLKRWSDRLIVATRDRLAINYPRIMKVSTSDAKYYDTEIRKQIVNITDARNDLIKAIKKGETLTLRSPVVQTFLKWANAMHGNIPDLGPHNGINIQVSDRLHLNAPLVERGRSRKKTPQSRKRALSPGSREAGNQSPERVRKGMAVSNDGKQVVMPEGHGFDLDDLVPEDRKRLKRHKSNPTSITKSDLNKTW